MLQFLEVQVRGSSENRIPHSAQHFHQLVIHKLTSCTSCNNAIFVGWALPTIDIYKSPSGPRVMSEAAMSPSPLNIYR